MPTLRAWLWAFLFTQAVEVPIWVHALREDRRPGRLGRGRGKWPPWIDVAAGFGASVITHPVVWFVIPRYAPGGYVAMAMQAETFAVVVEAVYMSALGLRWALGWSLLANGASAGLGLLSRSLFGWP
jgi:hypothetical protein